MSVNTMGYEQAATLLNNIVQQATGEKSLASVAPSDFISVANTALAAGYDKVLNAITQLVGRTLVSVRDYRGKFVDMELSDMEWGSIIRKLKIADVDWQDSAEFDLTDGQSVDQWVVKKPNVLQLNFYGQNTFELQSPSIFMDQLDAAFSGPGELNRFFAGIGTTMANQRRQKDESVRRMLIANFIGGKVAANNGVIHLISEYNHDTGLSLDAQTVYAPENFPDFVYWLYARMETLAGLMSERSEMFQINVTGKEIKQFTDPANLRVKMFAPLMNEINARVRAKTFANSYLEMAETEAINFWQSIESPNAINVTPTYMDTTGAIVTGAAQNLTDVVGIMYDRDAMGIVTQNERVMQTPFNARGHYSNIFWTYVQKWYSDFTEKAIVLKMD